MNEFRQIIISLIQIFITVVKKNFYIVVQITIFNILEFDDGSD